MNDRIIILEQKKAKLERLLAAKKSAVRVAKRKADTRRKIILGGWIIKAAETDIHLAALLSGFIDSLPDKDKQVFENWELGN